MSENLGDPVKWNSDSVYNGQGPTTSVAELKNRTNEWTNITEKEYTYSDDGGGNQYTSFKETMRARLITYTEAKKIEDSNGGTMPRWMYETADISYWTSTVNVESPYFVYYVGFGAYVTTGNVFNLRKIEDFQFGHRGLRPVIELTK